MMLYFHINKKLFSKHNLNQIAERYLNVLAYFVVFTQFLVFNTTQVSLKKLITAWQYLTNCIGLLYYSW